MLKTTIGTFISIASWTRPWVNRVGSPSRRTSVKEWVSVGGSSTAPTALFELASASRIRARAPPQKITGPRPACAAAAYRARA